VREDRLESIVVDGEICAQIFEYSAMKDGVEFITPATARLQVGSIKWPSGHKIIPHRHTDQPRDISGTSEVLLIMKGRLIAFFFDKNNRLNHEVIISAGSIVILYSGAHGFEIIDPCEIIEVKNGPYFAEKDKIRFEG
jgi:hypothetical protein